MTGIPQLKTINPYEKVQAETISDQAGINVRNSGNTVITDVQSGDWIKTSGVDFSHGAASLTISAASKNGGAVKICTGSPKGDVVGYAEVSASGGTFSEITVPVNEVSGTKDLYFIFSGDVEMDYWSFTGLVE